MPHAALAVIFNHRYEQNLPKLRALYAKRFPDLSFIMPFARSTDPDVIPVYESSYHFQSYITQAWERLQNCDADHFVFAGDDCILNPSLDAANIASEVGLDGDCAYIVEMISVHDQAYAWYHLRRVLAEAQAPETYFAWRSELPDVAQMQQRFQRHGLKTGPLRFEDRVRDHKRFGVLRDLRFFRMLHATGVLQPKIPIATGYSDLLIVPRKHMAEFVRYCRVFTAMGLFVEAAIPTALALSCPKVQTQRNSAWQCSVAWGETDVQAMTGPMEKSMRKLVASYGPKELAKHPIKLSAFVDDLD